MHNLSKIRLDALIQCLDAAILLEDENRMILQTNKEFCNLFSIPLDPAQLEGMDCSNSAEQAKHLFKDPAAFVQRIDAILAGKERVMNEQLEMADGKTLVRDYVPVYNNNEFIGNLWMYRNITEEVHKETEIRNTEEKYRRLIQNLELGLLEVDNNEHIIWANEAFCQLTGFQLQEITGRKATDVFINAELKEQFVSKSEERLTGRSSVYELTMVDKSGKELFLIISGTPVYDSQGNITGSVGIHFDITGRKQLEKDLLQSKEAAEKARMTEHQFLTKMSHEIRTPLNAIVGLTSILEETELSQQQSDLVRIIAEASDVLISLINSVLDYNRIITEHHLVLKKPFSPYSITQKLAKIFEARTHSGIHVSIKKEENFPDIVSGDEHLYTQVLMNLLSNSIKYSTGKEVIVSLKQCTEPSAGIIIQVKDDGDGIPPEELDLVFERFYRSKKHENKLHGTGLGLPIVKEIVEKSGGTVSIESIKGSGTTVTIMLPWQTDFSSRITQSTTDKEAVKGNKKIRDILLVEDTHINAVYIQQVLRKAGYNISVCADGESALGMLEKTSFDCVLLDINMPGIDGFEVLQRTREKGNTDLLVIAVTADSPAYKDLSRYYESGFDDLLIKPFKQELLIQKLNHVQSLHTLLGASDRQPLIDKQALRELYGDDQSHFSQLQEIFNTESAELIEQLEEHFMKHDDEKARACLHRLKPALGMMGLTELQKAAEKIHANLFDNQSLYMNYCLFRFIRNGTKNLAAQKSIEL